LSLPTTGVSFAEAGFVLAGGKSSRMGTDKALIPLGGRPLVARTINILHRIGLTPSIIGARSDLSAYAPVLNDAGLGPLTGVCVALSSTSAPYVVFLSVDMPLLPPSLIRFLIEHAKFTNAAVTVPSINGFRQTFPAVVHRSTLPAFDQFLSGGDTGCFSAFRFAADQLGQPFSILAVEPLIQAGQIDLEGDLPAAFWFLNVNTPGDLARAESLIHLIA
jgi:molybdopterin-guanine dinucleotide biosynthesis protein A